MATVGQPPSIRYWYSVAVVNDIAILYGGYGHPFRLSDTFALRFGTAHVPWIVHKSTVWKLIRWFVTADTETPTWLELKPQGEVPGPSSTHSVCVHNDRMYIFGGYDGKFRRGQVHAFQIGKPVSVSDIHASSANKCYGSGSADQVTADNIECSWRKIETKGRAPSPRYTHSAAMIGSKMVVYGGNSGCLKGDVYILDFGTYTLYKDCFTTMI